MQFAVDGVITRNHFAALDHLLATAKIAAETARFAHQQHAGCHVPGLQAAFPEAVIAARRHMGEIELARGFLGLGGMTA